MPLEPALAEIFMTNRKTQKKPRRATPASLEKAAANYLKRFDTTAAHLRQVLMNRVRRSAHFHDTDMEEGERAVVAVVERFVEAGLVDDLRYAIARAESLFRRGTSVRAIEFKLREKGASSDDIDAAVEKLIDGHEDLDLRAAINLVRRRRLGPFRNSEVRAAHHDKDLASLGRAGFDYGTAQRVIKADTVEALDAMLTDEDVFTIREFTR